MQVDFTYTSIWYARIYCAHAYLCRCDSTLFCFWKLKLRRLIFRVNCRSNLTINIVNQENKMKNEWLTMPTLIKENVLFDSKISSGWFSVAEGAEVDRTWLKPRELERKYLKIWSWETYKFLWNMSR